MASSKAIFHPRSRAFQIWGTHQGVGKTVATIAMTLNVATKGRGSKGAFYNLGYAKPISIGPEPEHQKILRVINKWRAGMGIPKYLDLKKIYHEYASTSDVAMLGKEIGEGSSRPIPDNVLLEVIKAYADWRADYLPSERGLPPPGSWVFFETLGGVKTRLPSNTPQADLYMSLRLPAILVGDSSPGGYEKTVEAHDYLRMRGYDVQGAFVYKDPDENYRKVADYFDEEGVHCAILRTPPEPVEDERISKNIMQSYYEAMGRANVVKYLLKHLDKRHAQRVRARTEGTETPEEIALAELALASKPEIERLAQLEQVEDRVIENRMDQIQLAPRRSTRSGDGTRPKELEPSSRFDWRKVKEEARARGEKPGSASF